MNQAYIVHVRDLFRSVWSAGTRRGAPSRAELQIALGISAVEGFGHWDGAMAGSNNFGGVQTSSERGDGIHYFGVKHSDQHLDGTKYVTHFRYYVDGDGRNAEENGAWDFLRQLSAPVRPLTGKALRSGSATAVAKAMHDEHYYEGFPPDPVGGYAKGITNHAREIAAALGEPLDVTGKSKKAFIAAAFLAAAVMAMKE